MYDLGGPASLAAAVTLRYQLSTLVIAPDLAGKAAHRLQLPWLTQTEAILGETTVERLRQQLITASLQLSSYRLGQRLLHADRVRLLANYLRPSQSLTRQAGRAPT